MNDIITYKEFKQFFHTNKKYVKWFDKFTGGQITVSSVNTQSAYTQEVQAVFIAFLSVAGPHKYVNGRVDFIQQWYKEKKGRAARLLKLYGSNSIIYKIKEDTLQEDTWYKLLDHIFYITLEEFNLAYLRGPATEVTPIKKLKESFVLYFTGEGKNKKESFNTYVGVPHYAESVINGGRNYSYTMNDEFNKFINQKSEVSFIDNVNNYLRNDKERKLELCSVLYKHITNAKTDEAFIKLLNKTDVGIKTRRNIDRVIEKCRLIYA